MDWSNMSALFADDIIAGTDTIANVPPLILDTVTAKVEAANAESQSKVATGDGGVAVKASSPDPVSVTQADYEATQPRSVASTPSATTTSKVAEPTEAPHVDATVESTTEQPAADDTVVTPTTDTPASDQAAN